MSAHDPLNARPSLRNARRRGTLALLAARRPLCLILGHRWMFLGICERCGSAHPSTKEKK